MCFSHDTFSNLSAESDWIEPVHDFQHKFFIYDLPSHFNLDHKQCITRIYRKQPACGDMTSHGLGAEVTSDDEEVLE